MGLLKRIGVLVALGALASGAYFKYRQLERELYNREHPSPNSPIEHHPAEGSVFKEMGKPQPPPPEQPNPTPEQQERIQLYSGGVYKSGNHFAILNYEGGQIAFFESPSEINEMVFCRSDGIGAPVSVEKQPHNLGRVNALCRRVDLDASGQCKTPIYPKPLNIVKSEVIQVKYQRASDPDYRLLLVSSERYRAARNTARNPVAMPFYAVYEMTGREIYRLPKLDVSSGSYVFGMAIEPTDASAVFGVGELMDVCNAEEDYEMPAKVREVYVWTPPANLKKINTEKRTPEVEALMKKFHLDEYWFEFYQWPENRHGC